MSAHEPNAHTAGAYTGFRRMTRLQVLLLPPGPPPVTPPPLPAFHQVSLIVCWYPFTQPGFEPGPFDPDSSALTTRPPRLILLVYKRNF